VISTSSAAPSSRLAHLPPLHELLERCQRQSPVDARENACTSSSRRSDDRINFFDSAERVLRRLWPARRHMALRTYRQCTNTCLMHFAYPQPPWVEAGNVSFLRE
jgi:hypothetical protein